MFSSLWRFISTILFIALIPVIYGDITSGGITLASPVYNKWIAGIDAVNAGYPRTIELSWFTRAYVDDADCSFKKGTGKEFGILQSEVSKRDEAVEIKCPGRKVFVLNVSRDDTAEAYFQKQKALYVGVDKAPPSLIDYGAEAW